MELPKELGGRVGGMARSTARRTKEGVGVRVTNNRGGEERREGGVFGSWPGDKYGDAVFVQSVSRKGIDQGGVATHQVSRRKELGRAKRRVRRERWATRCPGGDHVEGKRE